MSSALSVSAFGSREKAEISRYIDGDSFVLSIDGESEEVRMIGADTPEAFGNEKNQNSHATAASNFFKSRIKKGEEFEIERISDDSDLQSDVHDRSLVWVYVDGKELGLELVENGLALPYMYCSESVCQSGYQKFLKSHKVKEHLDACEQARKDGKGVWSAKNPLEEIPQEYRRRKFSKKQQEKTKYFIGSYSNNEYVSAGQENYTEEEIGIGYCDRIQFEKEADAIAAGFKLAKKGGAAKPAKPAANKAAATPQKGKRSTAVVAKYTDGDSFKAFVDGETTPTTIRMIGADTPEAYGKEGTNQKVHATHASDFFKKRLPMGKEFEVEWLETDTGTDAHGRSLGWVYVDGKELGLELVTEGLALPYMYCARDVCQNNGYAKFLQTHHVKEHLEACEQARKDEKGVWDDSTPKVGKLELIPQEFRRVQPPGGAKRIGKTRYYIGSYSTKVLMPYDLADYSEKTIGIDDCDRIIFDEESHATAAGFKRAKNVAWPTKPPFAPKK